MRRIAAGTARVVAIHWDAAIIRRGPKARSIGTATIAKRAARARIRKRQRGVIARRKGCARTIGALGSLRRAGTAAYVWMRVTHVAGGNENPPIRRREINRLRCEAPYDCGRDSTAVCRAVHT